jgi:hypothetical protein
MDNIQAEERAILEGISDWDWHGRGIPEIESVELFGEYPETILRIVASKRGYTRALEWPVWDGQMTGSPAGVGSGPEEFLQMLGVDLIYWRTARNGPGAANHLRGRKAAESRPRRH